MRWVLVLAITFASTLGRAHVGPSVDDNNRYLKVTPAADRVRIAYTVFFGEVPGAQMRRTVDANRDGRIDDAEAQAFGDRLAGEVAAGLELSVDGAAQKVTWTTVAVGVGVPQVAAGAFSVDLIAWACLASPHGTHAVTIKDRFRIPRPGETEVKVEDGLGITIHHARVGRADDPTHAYRFVGPGGPLADHGLDLSFTAGAQAPLTDDGRCRIGDAADAAPAGRVAVVIAMLGAALAVLATLSRPGRRR